MNICKRENHCVHDAVLATLHRVLAEQTELNQHGILFERLNDMTLTPASAGVELQ